MSALYLYQRADILQVMVDTHKLDSTEEDNTDSLVNVGNTTESSSKKVALSTDEIMANVSGKSSLRLT